MTTLSVRSVSAAEFSTALDWAAQEGWNPGLDDMEAFHAADPHGFMMGFVGDEPVSSISVVRYGTGFGFLGFYIVAEPHRGKQYGIETWRAGLAHLSGRVVGLDGVPTQTENYRKSGFAPSGRNVRYQGRLTPDLFARPEKGLTIASVTDHVQLLGYDRALFPERRDQFLAHWARDVEGRRKTRLATRDGALVGYGTVRKCRAGFKLGPLFADDRAVAEALLCDLASVAVEGEEIVLDVPQRHGDAIALAEDIGLVPVFETTRMYLGPEPALDHSRIFGLTSFELG